MICDSLFCIFSSPMTPGQHLSKQAKLKAKPKPGRVLADASNRRQKWVAPTMVEFRGSSIANPWLLDSHGALVLPAARAQKMTFTGALAKTASVPLPNRKRNFQGPPSSIFQDPPVANKAEGARILSTVDILKADSGAGGRHKVPSHICATRDCINQTPRLLSGNSDEGAHISSAATRPVRCTAAKKAWQDLFDNWQFM
ncbi:hypothetical protein K438DRAFT_2016215 [Mycena galopus ATCC 62051]|nr:hypothetical protein K438DRAFT_2016215 [Mycena galopus ATCC 62051]